LTSFFSQNQFRKLEDAEAKHLVDKFRAALQLDAIALYTLDANVHNHGLMAYYSQAFIGGAQINRYIFKFALPWR
jgi:hypothetical protein